MKHLIKFLSIFLTITIIVVSPALSVSAAMGQEIFQEEIRAMKTNFGDSVVDGVSIVAYNSSTGKSEILAFNGVKEVDNPRGAQLTFTAAENFVYGERYIIGVRLRINNDSYLNSDNFVSGSYRIGFTSERFRILHNSSNDNESLQCYTYRYNGSNSDVSNYSQFGEMEYLSTEYGNYADSIFTPGKSGETFNYYFTCLCVTPTINSFKTFSVMLYYWDFEVLSNLEYNSNKIIENQNDNTDKILNAGGNVNQPDFDSTNANINNTLSDMTEIEKQFVIDHNTTNENIGYGLTFMQGHDMQNASIQVKNWIEKFFSDNSVMSGFFISCMVLGVCFWVIGRKSW